MQRADRSTAGRTRLGDGEDERRFEHGPLDVRQVRAVDYDGDSTDV